MLHMGIFLSGLKPAIISINISHKKVYFIEYKTHSYSTGLKKIIIQKIQVISHVNIKHVLKEFLNYH